MITDADIIAAVREHAAREAPRECCGLIIEVNGVPEYRPCRNISPKANNFAIHHEDWAAGEDAGNVLAVCHSHVFRSPLPTDADKTMCEKTGLPWLIVNHPVGTVATLMPSGFTAPLKGRQFVFGVHDCYALVRDYYATNLAITLPDFPRNDPDWWKHGDNLIAECFDTAGFRKIERAELRLHDVIGMQLLSEGVCNHVGIYLGRNEMLHHMLEAVSGVSVFGGQYFKSATLFLRHREMLTC